MPRIVVGCTWLLVGACAFHADYSSGLVFCSAGKCPAGLECRTDFAPPQCHPPRLDAAISDGDGRRDGSSDAALLERSCARPGSLTSGVALTDTTTGRMNQMWTSCDASIQNGNDAVYQITTPVSGNLLVTISGIPDAYVVSTCTPQSTTPGCLGGTSAKAGSSISVAVTSGTTYWVVVDNVTAGSGGAGPFTLTVTAP